MKSQFSRSMNVKKGEPRATDTSGSSDRNMNLSGDVKANQVMAVEISRYSQSKRTESL